MSEFPGWEPPLQNWSKLPHKLIEMAPDMKESELRVTLYLLRHTWGWGNFTDFQSLTLDEFQNGRVIGGNRVDRGTGLSKQSVISALKTAVGERKTIEEVIDDSDKARTKKKYRLRSLKIGQQPNVSLRSKISTPGVKNLDTEHNKETSKDTSPPKAEQKRKETVRDRFSRQMEEQFSSCSGVPTPDVSTIKKRRAAGTRWYSPLWTLYKLHRPEEERTGDASLTYDTESLERTLALIDAAVSHCKAEKLTLSAPQSIEQVAISIFSQGNYAATTESDDFWKQHI